MPFTTLWGVSVPQVGKGQYLPGGYEVIWGYFEAWSSGYSSSSSTTTHT